MKTIFLKSATLLLLLLSINLVNAQGSSYKKIPLDSLSNITINKLIYFQEPLYFKKGNLSNKSYLPEWYNAECAISNISDMNASEKVKYFSIKLGVKEGDLARLDEDTAAINSRKRQFDKWPSKIFYGEVWITINKTGQQVVLVLNTLKEKEFENLKFNGPTNNNYEAINANGSNYEPTVFIYEDGILKAADQYEIISQFTKSRKETISVGLEAFQDLLFRSNSYIRSNIQKGKRIFETVENTPSGMKVSSIRNEP